MAARGYDDVDRRLEAIELKLVLILDALEEHIREHQEA